MYRGGDPKLTTLRSDHQCNEPGEQVNEATDDHHVTPIKLAQMGFATPPTAKIPGCLRRIRRKIWRCCHGLSAFPLGPVSMHMLVMCIWHMRMAVTHALMMMHMGMRANDHRRVGMVVVPVRMVMSMFMVLRRMKVLMPVALSKVKYNIAQHQQSPHHHQAA